MTRSCARSAMPLVSAAYWGMHMVWGLHSPLRFVAAIATDFSLGRVWKRDVGANTCRALKAGCADPSQCSSADVLRRPWQDIATVTHMPRRQRPVEYAFGAEQTSRACGVGYFTCHGESKMCREEQTTWEPMDTTPMRRAWFECTPFGYCQQVRQAFCLAPSERRCPDPTLDRTFRAPLPLIPLWIAPPSLQFGLSPYSPQCAGAMLAVWTTIWKHSPVVPNTVSFDL